MSSRREFLAVGLSIVTVGCMSADSSSSPATTTGSPSGGGGNPAPWGREDSAMDVGVESSVNAEVTVTIEFEDSELVRHVGPGATWVSENIIDSGTTPTVVLRVEDGPREAVTWKAEEENERFLLFEVTREGIDYEMSRKGATDRTQVTEKPTE